MDVCYMELQRYSQAGAQGYDNKRTSGARGCFVRRDGQSATMDNLRWKSMRLSGLRSLYSRCRRNQISDEETHLGLYREVRNVTVGLYIHCSMVSYTQQCVGVTLINEALWLL